MVNKGGKVSSSSAATGGKTSAAPGKGGKPRAQDEKAIDETVSQSTLFNPISETKGEEEEEEERRQRDSSVSFLCIKQMDKRKSFASGISIKVGPNDPLAAKYPVVFLTRFAFVEHCSALV